MGLADGDLYVSGSILSFQQMKRIYQNFRAATVPSNLQAGALWSDSDDDKLYHKGASLFEVYTGATELYTWKKGADKASAATLDISALDGNYFDVTGTTDITAISTSGRSGTIINLHFDGILTIVHDGDDIVLPDGKNIYTMAGTELEFIEYAAGKWRCTTYLKAQPVLTNLLSNSGFGVWSQSDANKGLASIPYDTGDKGGGSAPSVGDSGVGGTSGAVGKVISYTISTGAWADGDAIGVLTLGAVTGTFIDNEIITFETNQETCLVNGDESIGITNDPCNNDDTGDWTQDGDSLGFDTDHYEWATSAVNKYCYKGSLAFTKGKIYKIEIDLKDGIAEPTDIKIYFYDGAEQIDKAINTTGSFVKYTATFECATTVTNTGRAGIKAPTSLGGNDIEIRRFSCYEITPCCTAHNAFAFDGWYKNNATDLCREHNGSNTKEGSFYALKFIPVTGADYVYSPLSAIRQLAEHMEKFASRTLTIGAWVKTSTASHARIYIYDDAAYYSSYHTGGGAYEWLEVTHTFAASPTYAHFGFEGAIAAAIDGSTIVYVSQPMLVFGSHIGEGNYRPRQQEIIWLEKKIPSNLFDGLINQSSSGAWLNLNLEADSDAMLPKGTKGVTIFSTAKDSASFANDVQFLCRIDTIIDNLYTNNPAGLGNDILAQRLGFQPCDADGYFQYRITASGAGTFDFSEFAYKGIQVN